MPVKTKGEHINDAYAQLRISGLTVEPTPAEQEKALNRMEDMAAEFESRNICINYAFEEVPDPATISGVNVEFNYMMSTNLATRLIPDFGKKTAKNDSLSDLKKQASQSLSNASARTAIVNPVEYPTRMPIGSGNTFRWNRWRRFYKPKEPAPASCETEPMQLNTAGRFIATWADWLADGETITDFVIKVSDGLTLLDSQIQNDDTEVFYRVQADKKGFQKVTITIVTSISTPQNADVREINFNVLFNDSDPQ